MKKLFFILLIPIIFIGCNSSVPSGTIIAFAGDKDHIPAGWLLCNGDTLDRTKYSELFNAVGTYWGGEGVNDFILPDLRGQFLRGVDMGANIDEDASERFDFHNHENQIGDRVGSFQKDAFKEHKHDNGTYANHWPSDSVKQAYGSSGGRKKLAIPDANWNSGFFQYKGWTSTDGVSESRPKNASVNWIIKF